MDNPEKEEMTKKTIISFGVILEKLCMYVFFSLLRRDMILSWTDNKHFMIIKYKKIKFP